MRDRFYPEDEPRWPAYLGCTSVIMLLLIIFGIAVRADQTLLELTRERWCPEPECEECEVCEYDSRHDLWMDGYRTGKEENKQVTPTIILWDGKFACTKGVPALKPGTDGLFCYDKAGNRHAVRRAE
jgi:hypothetical protein